MRRLTGFDYRSLAAFRVAFGLTLIGNLWIRFSDGKIDAHYTDDGLLPLALVRNAIPAPRWSFLDAFNEPTSVRIAFAAILLVYVCYTAGLFTRLMQVLVVVALVSLYNRNPLIDDGSDCAMRTWAAWTAFLPLGARWSADVRWRRKPALTGDHLSSAVIGLVIVLTLDYFLNAFQKEGAWGDGTAFRNVFWDPWTGTPIGVALRPYMTDRVTWVLTRTALTLEYALSGAVLLSLLNYRFRRIAVAGMFILHGGIALVLFIGSFAWTYMSLALLFIPGCDWDRLRAGGGIRPLRRARRSRGDLVVDGLSILFLLFALSEAISSNPIFSRRLKVAVARWRGPTVTALHHILLMPNEWYKFRLAPREQTFGVLEIETATGERLDFVRGTPIDLERPILQSAHLGKYWVSYTFRLHLPFYDRFRGALDRYLRAHGAVRWWMHEVRVVAPSHAASRPASISHRVLFEGARSTVVDFKRVTARSDSSVLISRRRLTSSDAKWVGSDHLFLRFNRPGDYVLLAFDHDRACVADVIVHYTRAPDYGATALELNVGNGAVLDGWSPLGMTPALTHIGQVPLHAGENTLRVELISPLGPERGTGFGIDALETLCVEDR